MPAYKVGSRAGPYEVVQVLGSGSFGIVWLARDTRHEAGASRKVALKTVSCDHLDHLAAARTRDATLSEAGLLSRMRHPHIVTCYDMCWEADQRVVWLALEFMAGGDAKKLIDRRRGNSEPPFEAAFVRQTLAAIGAALCHIHAHRVLHRDVKPANFLLTDAGQIKLADFGVSKILEATVNARTLIGTPCYMSPEIISGEAYGAPSDAWALGICLFELATLRRPFEAENPLALAMKIGEEEPEPLPPGATEPDLAGVIAGLLLKDPRQRMPLAEALRVSEAVAGLVPAALPEAGASAPASASLALLPPMCPPLLGPQPAEVQAAFMEASMDSLSTVHLGTLPQRSLVLLPRHTDGAPQAAGGAEGWLQYNDDPWNHEPPAAGVHPGIPQALMAAAGPEGAWMGAGGAEDASGAQWFSLNAERDGRFSAEDA